MKKDQYVERLMIKMQDMLFKQKMIVKEPDGKITEKLIQSISIWIGQLQMFSIKQLKIIEKLYDAGDYENVVWIIKHPISYSINEMCKSPMHDQKPIMMQLSLLVPIHNPLNTYYSKSWIIMKDRIFDAITFAESNRN